MLTAIDGAPGHGAVASADAGGADVADVARFLERFRRFGAAPGVATYLPLFHPDARLFDDGMERPITVKEIPDSITATLALAQGFVMVPERWRARDGAVLVEARNEATILGTACRWQSVYRVRLEGDLVIDGRRYYDREPLLAAFDPATPRLPSLAPDATQLVEPDALPCLDRGVTPAGLVELCSRSFARGDWRDLAALLREDATWHAPGVAGAFGRDAVAGHRARLARLLGGATARVRRWAGDDALVMIEWQADVPTPSGAAYVLGMVDRFDLAAGRVLAARTYLDAATLARALTAAA
jgi:ketosteroid isomerase-like protein